MNFNIVEHASDLRCCRFGHDVKANRFCDRISFAIDFYNATYISFLQKDVCLSFDGSQREAVRFRNHTK